MSKIQVKVESELEIAAIRGRWKTAERDTLKNDSVMNICKERPPTVTPCSRQDSQLDCHWNLKPGWKESIYTTRRTLLDDNFRWKIQKLAWIRHQKCLLREILKRDLKLFSDWSRTWLIDLRIFRSNLLSSDCWLFETHCLQLNQTLFFGGSNSTSTEEQFFFPDVEVFDCATWISETSKSKSQHHRFLYIYFKYDAIF